MNDDLPAVPIADVLGGLKIPQVGEGQTPTHVFAMIKCLDEDGDESFVVRVTAGLDDDELLGVLTGYVKYLRDMAAASWRDHGGTSFSE